MSICEISQQKHGKLGILCRLIKICEMGGSLIKLNLKKKLSSNSNGSVSPLFITKWRKLTSVLSKRFIRSPLNEGKPNYKLKSVKLGK